MHNEEPIASIEPEPDTEGYILLSKNPRKSALVVLPIFGSEELRMGEKRPLVSVISVKSDESKITWPKPCVHIYPYDDNGMCFADGAVAMKEPLEWKGPAMEWQDLSNLLDEGNYLLNDLLEPKGSINAKLDSSSGVFLWHHNMLTLDELPTIRTAGYALSIFLHWCSWTRNNLRWKEMYAALASTVTLEPKSNIARSLQDAETFPRFCRDLGLKKGLPYVGEAKFSELLRLIERTVKSIQKIGNDPESFPTD